MRAISLLLASLAFSASAHEGPAPNRIDISPTLSTSGQPTRAFLETLKAQGFDIPKAAVRMPHGPIKHTGEQTLSVSLHTDVAVDVKVVVVGDVD